MHYIARAVYIAHYVAHGSELYSALCGAQCSWGLLCNAPGGCYAVLWALLCNALGAITQCYYAVFSGGYYAMRGRVLVDEDKDYSNWLAKQITYEKMLAKNNDEKELLVAESKN